MLSQEGNSGFSASQLRKELRQARADKCLANMIENDEDLGKAILENKFGCMCMLAGKLEISEKHFIKSQTDLERLLGAIPLTNVLMNFGNLNAQLRINDMAIKFYQRVINESPYQNEDQHDQRGVLWSARLNSYNAFVDAHTNLACLLANVDKLSESYDYCVKAIKMNPLNFEAQTNLGDLLRQLGRKQEALSHTWQQIVKFSQISDPAYEQPQSIECKQLKPLENQSDVINIFCVKWGKKYGADYVNKLFNGVSRNTTLKFRFFCLTDEATDLNPSIQILALEEGWTGWWGKSTLFSLLDYEGRMFYIDLDVVITGNIDEILNYRGSFAILRTDEIACEKLNKNGYNSSIMAWCGNKYFCTVYDELKRNKVDIQKFIVRFDFWLEMMIKDADFLQEIFPSQISDYVLECQGELPAKTNIVSFPRTPKPHIAEASWILDHWI